jgi:hypothetical protein
MPRLAPWMQIADVQFLALLENAGEPLPVPVIAEHTFFPVEYVRRRCGLLDDAKLLTSVGGDVYELDGRGAAFLDGELDPGSL